MNVKSTPDGFVVKRGPGGLAAVLFVIACAGTAAGLRSSGLMGRPTNRPIIVTAVGGIIGLAVGVALMRAFPVSFVEVSKRDNVIKLGEVKKNQLNTEAEIPFNIIDAVIGYSRGGWGATWTIHLRFKTDARIPPALSLHQVEIMTYYHSHKRRRAPSARY